jgi:hypothetical protein
VRFGSPQLPLHGEKRGGNEHRTLQETAAIDHDGLRVGELEADGIGPAASA